MTSPPINLIQETAIEKILEEHIWTEIHLLTAKSRELMLQVELLDARCKMLTDIANVAGIPEPT